MTPEHGEYIVECIDHCEEAGGPKACFDLLCIDVAKHSGDTASRRSWSISCRGGHTNIIGLWIEMCYGNTDCQT
uniref:Uncharacterized protein n=1 Tax=Lepeophtheirus salmonis TaxID=72036 RepID=A0A0K2ULN3_LEPSM